MRKHLALAAGAIAALTFTGSANAADMPVYKTPVVTVFSWTGCYFGGHVGILRVHKDWTFVTGGANVPFGDHYANGWLGGAQAGCNYQIDRFVFGIQGDYAWADAKGSNANLILPLLGDYSNVRSLGSVTGRVGYALDRWLLYVKGGWAWERDRYNLSGTLLATPGIAAAVVPGQVSASASETRGGWTLGVGSEYAFLNNWTAFVEYDYYNFGTRTVRFYNDSTGTPAADIDIRERKSVVKIGVNYKFGGYAVVAKY